MRFFGGAAVSGGLVCCQASPVVIRGFAGGTAFTGPFSAGFIAISSLTSSFLMSVSLALSIVLNNSFFYYFISNDYLNI